MYPKLVIPRWARTDITARIDRGGVDVYGEPLEPVVWKGKCNFQNRAGTVFTEYKKEVQITGTAYIDGDICPGLPDIPGGTAEINGQVYRIVSGSKNRDPDGTVNFTAIFLK